MCEEKIAWMTAPGQWASVACTLESHGETGHTGHVRAMRAGGNRPVEATVTWDSPVEDAVATG